MRILNILKLLIIVTFVMILLLLATSVGGYMYLNPKEEFEKAEEYAEKALKLNQNIAEAHLALARIKMSNIKN